MKTMKKKNWLKITLCVLLACAVLGTVVSGILFSANKGKASASATIEFSFDGAAEGIAPNGYAFSVSGITSDTVLNRALAAAGMADRYTADQIRPQLQTAGVYPENIVEQMTSYESLLDFSANRELNASAYHPTLYSVTLSAGFDESISQADLEKLLGCIMAAYKEWFAEAYAVGTNTVAVQYDLEKYDYPQRLSILTRLMEESAAYAEELYEKQPTLTKGGRGFNDIAVRLRNLIDTEIARLNANVTINALTKDSKRLITQYQYEIVSLSNQKEKKATQLQQMDVLRSAYEKNEIIYLSTADSLTKIDGNSSETYDKLVAMRKSVADEITNIETSIDTYNQRLKDLTGEEEEAATAETAPAVAAPAAGTDPTDETGETEAETEETVAPALTEEELAELSRAADEAKEQAKKALEADIDVLLAEREAIMKDFADLIRLYNDQQINDLTVAVSKVKYDAPRLLSGAFIKQTLKVTGPFVAVGFMVCLVLLILSRRKEH